MAAPVATIEQARAWITQWRDLQGVKVSDDTPASPDTPSVAAAR